MTDMLKNQTAVYAKEITLHPTFVCGLLAPSAGPKCEPRHRDCKFQRFQSLWGTRSPETEYLKTQKIVHVDNKAHET